MLYDFLDGRDVWTPEEERIMWIIIPEQLLGRDQLQNLSTTTINGERIKNDMSVPKENSISKDISFL